MLGVDNTFEHLHVQYLVNTLFSDLFCTRHWSFRFTGLSGGTITITNPALRARRTSFLEFLNTAQRANFITTARSLPHVVRKLSISIRGSAKDPLCYTST